MRKNNEAHEKADAVVPMAMIESARHLTEKQPARLLIVEDDEDLATLLAEHLAETLRVEVTLATSCREAVDIELTKPQDLILSDLLLPDGDAVSLQRQLQGISTAGFVLMSGVPTVNRVVEAMRLGAMDFLVKPFDLSQLTAAVSDALGRLDKKSQLQMRYVRMRRLAKRILQDRRELRNRVDLVCRDLVQAYRRLARRVVELYDMYDHQPEEEN
jgi:DNA-binding NtrC family response regulator